jgi:3-methylcrotonyl-CoA carboxylase alpha subunit
MKAADVPCIPGWHPSTTGNAPTDPSVNTQSADFLIHEADKIGYPVLIKAVSGGGGKGMKIVDKREDFASQLESAKREGKKSFGDDTVLLEKYVTKPRREFFPYHRRHLMLYD